jgi:hypothetical protein
MNKSIKEITILAIATSVLIVQEFALTMLPNIQLTTLLIMVYTSVFGYKNTSLIVTVHVIIDNLIFGSFAMLHIIVPMFIGWQLVVIIFYFIQKRTSNIIIYAVIAYLFGHLYGLVFVPFQGFILNVDMLTYLIADLPFQLIMALTNFIVILWLYQPIYLYLNKLYSKYMMNH